MMAGRHISVISDRSTAFMNVAIVVITANINKTGRMTPGGVMVCDYLMD